MKQIYCLILAGTLFVNLLIGSPLFTVAKAEAAGLKQGQELYQAGDLDQALAVLRSTVRQSPDSHETAQASILIGRIFTQQHNYTDAILYLQRIPAMERSPEVELLLGNALVETGQYDTGLKQLQPLINEPLNQTDKLMLYRALTTASIKKQMFLFSLYYLQQQLSFNANSAAILAQAHTLLQSQISDADLAEATFIWQETAIGQDALLQQARRTLVQQKPELAKQHLQKLFASSATFPYWQEAEQLLQRSSGDTWLNRDSIGILLPLTGRYASYGQLVKQGLELALQEHNKTRLPARFVYRDTAIEGVAPAPLVSSLTDDDKVMAVIGPLLGTRAGKAARRAQQEMVPLLTLAQTEGLPELGNFIFRDTLTAEQQVKALIKYAMENGQTSFSILRPENRLGEKMSAAFVAELENAGGELIDIVTYPDDSTDFRKEVQKLLWQDRPEYIAKLKAMTEEEREALKKEYPQPPFQALFIPDYADRISLIAPQLMFYGIKDVTLLGINGWNSPEIIVKADRFLKDAVFVDTFYPNSKKPEVKRFIDLYRQAYKEEPTILSAQGFDMATLLLQIIDDPEVKNRDDLRRKLADLNHYPGVTGTTGFDPYGEAIKALYLLKVEHGQVVEVE